MKMNQKLLSFLLGCAIASPVIAEHRGRDLSYSPDHWPSRWSTAIRQQQSGNYPTRQIENTPPPELPSSDSIWEVSEHDLFSAPATERYNRPARRGGRKTPSYFRDYKKRTIQPRRAAFAYYGMPPLSPAQVHPGSANGLNNIAIDPVLGHPGMGIPIMPGTPYGYPFMGYSPAHYPGAIYPGSMYPGSVGMWNPPFGAW